MNQGSKYLLGGLLLVVGFAAVYFTSPAGQPDNFGEEYVANLEHCRSMKC